MLAINMLSLFTSGGSDGLYRTLSTELSLKPVPLVLYLLVVAVISTLVAVYIVL